MGEKKKKEKSSQELLNEWNNSKFGEDIIIWVIVTFALVLAFVFLGYVILLYL